MFKNLKDFSVANKRILVRCDFNVPLDKKGDILDDFRIRKSLPTIEYLIENKAKIVLMSHLDPESAGVADKKYTMDEVAKKLSENLGFPVHKQDDCIGPVVEMAVQNLKSGEVLLLENLRFYKQETENNREFSQQLASLGDVYVNDAFSVCHRDHASISGITEFLTGSVGLLLESEISALNKIMNNPAKPMVALVGGTKVKTKSKFINKISEQADVVIVSGLIKKEIEEQSIQFNESEKIIGPSGELGAPDINDESIEVFKKEILKAKTILWNGPFGKFEEKEYEKGTLAIANAIIDSGAFSVVGGGETVEFLAKQGIIEKFSHVSTGGGAMLSYLAGERLPGLEALKQ